MNKIALGIRTNKIVSLLPYVCAFILIFLPSLKGPKAIWDGTIIDYANRTGDFSGIKSWLMSSGWDAQYVLIRVEFFIAKILNLNFATINSVILFIAMSVVVFETGQISVKNFKFSKNVARSVQIILIILPIWTVTISSVMTFHMTALAAGIIGCRWLEKHASIKYFIGILLIAYSTQLSSMLFFLPCYQLALFVTRKNTEKNEFRSIQSLIITLTIVVTAFVFKTTLNKNSGIYEDYNQIINVLSLHGIRTLVTGLINYSTFLAIPFFILMVRRISNTLYLREMYAGNQSKHKIIVIFLLFIGSTSPYALVGKSSNIFEYSDWNYRQAILLGFPIALLSGFFLSISREQQPLQVRKVIERTLIGSLVISLVILTGVSLAGKIQRANLDTLLVSALRKDVNEPIPGRVLFILDQPITPSIRNYESNYLTFLAYGKLNWWTEVAPKEGKISRPPKNLKNLPASEFLYKSSEEAKNCDTYISFGLRGYAEKPRDILKVLFQKDSMKLQVNNTSVKCVGN